MNLHWRLATIRLPAGTSGRRCVGRPQQEALDEALFVVFLALELPSVPNADAIVAYNEALCPTACQGDC